MRQKGFYTNIVGKGLIFFYTINDKTILIHFEVIDDFKNYRLAISCKNRDVLPSNI